jgi:pyruvate carboxylase subunit B
VKEIEDRSLARVRITDTTFRDAHQSLAATKMRTEHMMPIAEKMDSVGFFSMEVWGGATFDVSIRYLGEDPWERVRQLKKKIRRTPLQMLLRGQNLVGYRNYADDVVVKFVETAADVGIDIFRVFDALNDTRNMETAIRAAQTIGKHVQGTVCYTVSPVHTLRSYIRVAKELAHLGCDSICLKDMSGILAPADAFKIVNALKKQVRLPVDVHSHCTSGMAPLAYFSACEAGVDILDTAFSPFAGGTSQPAVESIVGALKGSRYDTGLDLRLLVDISKYFRNLRERNRGYFNVDPRSETVDSGVLIHQIPGGMISNLIAQLKEQNALDKFDDVLKETPRVRKDLGYPPLVTPTSQIVGTQAVMNVLSGERYKTVLEEVKHYIRGLYGRHPARMNTRLRKKILGNERVITYRPADAIPPELEKTRQEADTLISTDEDLLTYALFPQVGADFLRRRGCVGREICLDSVVAVAVALAKQCSTKEEHHLFAHANRGHFGSPWRSAGIVDLHKSRSIWQGFYVDRI